MIQQFHSWAYIQTKLYFKKIHASLVHNKLLLSCCLQDSPFIFGFQRLTLICFCIDLYKFISLAVSELLACVDSHLLLHLEGFQLLYSAIIAIKNIFQIFFLHFSLTLGLLFCVHLMPTQVP